ncbi:hypothetical protein B0H14DRAFT_3452092 [Mycena olivaceomarginata]|nr:hypothetical protein B0H14DRAFT_3452092 [Mycena olivaceomarginata]
MPRLESLATTHNGIAHRKIACAVMLVNGSWRLLIGGGSFGAGLEQLLECTPFSTSTSTSISNTQRWWPLPCIGDMGMGGTKGPTSDSGTTSPPNTHRSLPSPTRPAHALHARLLSWVLDAPAAPFGMQRFWPDVPSVLSFLSSVCFPLSPTLSAHPPSMPTFPSLLPAWDTTDRASFVRETFGDGHEYGNGRRNTERYAEKATYVARRAAVRTAVACEGPRDEDQGTMRVGKGRAACEFGFFVQDNDTTGHLQKMRAQVGSFCPVAMGIFIIA